MLNALRSGPDLPVVTLESRVCAKRKGSYGKAGSAVQSQRLVRNKNHKTGKNKEESITTKLGEIVSNWMSGH